MVGRRGVRGGGSTVLEKTVRNLRFKKTVQKTGLTSS